MILGVTIMSFLVGYLVFAWTEPTAAPPGGNVNAPINVAGGIQRKAGGLNIGPNDRSILAGEIAAQRYCDNDNPTACQWYVDPANSGYAALFQGKVGIGTTSPGMKLDIRDTVTESLWVRSGTTYLFAGADDTNKRARIGAYQEGVGWKNLLINEGGGNVGIGTTTPAETLTVAGGTQFGQAPTTAPTLLQNMNSSQTTANVNTAGFPSTGTLVIDSEVMTYTGKTANTFTGLTRGAFGTTAALHSSGASVQNYLLIASATTSTAPKMAILGSSGNVGIGTAIPNQKLTVNGTINGNYTAEGTTCGANQVLKRNAAGNTWSCAEYKPFKTNNMGVGTTKTCNSECATLCGNTNGKVIYCAVEQWFNYYYASDLTASQSCKGSIIEVQQELLIAEEGYDYSISGQDHTLCHEQVGQGLPCDYIETVTRLNGVCLCPL